MEYTVEQGKIICADGVPHLPRWFADNRLAFSLDGEGVADIDYHGPSNGHYKAFLKCFWGGLRLYLRTGRQNVRLRFANCELWPFGITGEVSALGGKHTLQLFAADDTLFIRLLAGDMLPVGTELWAEFYDNWRMSPYMEDIRYTPRGERRWQDWVFNGNLLETGYEEQNGETAVCFGTNFPLRLLQTPVNVKYSLCSPVLSPGGVYEINIAFGPDRETAHRRASADGIEAYASQTARYEEVAIRAPRLISGYPGLDDFMALAPLFHESMKTTDLPGGLRARTTFYWIWGWDSFSSADAIGYWGDWAFLEEMLDFHRKYAHPEKGIAHAYTRDMRVASIEAPPAQGMYITLLHVYTQHGGDPSPYYPFALRLFDMILETEIGDSGLCRGSSLFPDFRNLIGETGQDISAFNNTVSYCAARSLEQLALHMGDTKTQALAGGFADRLKNHFQQTLFSPDIGFFVSSADAETGERRPIPSNNAIKWENSYCGDLIAGVERPCLDFYEKELICPAGIRPMPQWSGVYDADANQLHCWWPIMSEFYTRLLNRLDRPAEIERFIETIIHWTGRLTVPEGISCYESEGMPGYNNWNDLCGTWQAYNIRGWYNAVMHSVVGVELHGGQLIFHPRTGPEMRLEGLHVGNRAIDIHIKGSGNIIKALYINGASMFGNAVPADSLPDRAVIEVIRGS